MAHLNVLNRMNADNVPSTRGRPTRLTQEWSIFSNGEAAQLVHVESAHSDGDTVVFRRSDVISTGAIFDASGYPRFDPARGGSIAGVIEGLNRVLDIAVPGENQEGGTVIVPGRGRLSDETDVANYRDMVIIRDRVRAMVAKGCRSSRCNRLNRRRLRRTVRASQRLDARDVRRCHLPRSDEVGERDSAGGPKQ